MDYKVARFPGLKELGEQGEFIATIAKLNHIDLDGDVTLSGAFPEGVEVHIAAWGHNWNVPSVGVATLHEEGDEIRAHGAFTLETVNGREHYESIKKARNIQEWSYGFHIDSADFGTFEGHDVRFLKAVDVAEVSPVMRGAAGPGITRIEAIKSIGLTMDEQSEAALIALSDFLDRVKSHADLRDGQGRKRISRANADRISRVHSGIAEALPALEELLALTRDSDTEDAGEPKAAAIPWDLIARADYVLSKSGRALSNV